MSGDSRMKQKAADILSRIPFLSRVYRWGNAHRKAVTRTIVVVAHLLGALTSVKAIMETRTSQGAVAWAVSLNTCPYIAVPAYWIFGQKNFVGYVKLRRSEAHEIDPFIQRVGKDLVEGDFLVTPNAADRSVVEKLAKLSMSCYNSAELLIDGEVTFNAIFEEIEAAEDYVLVQFYIVRDDRIGNRLKDLLQEKVAEGVRVYFIYDEIGSYNLPTTYITDLRDGGVDIRPFNTRQGSSNRFQINFRNHRKIVVADGKVAFVGGHNVGDRCVVLMSASCCPRIPIYYSSICRRSPTLPLLKRRASKSIDIPTAFCIKKPCLLMTISPPSARPISTTVHSG